MKMLNRMATGRTAGSGRSGKPVLAPFLFPAIRVRSRMLDLCLALTPVYVWAIYLYGWRVAVLAGISVLCSGLFECWTAWVLGRKPEPEQGCFLVNGLLTVCLMPPSAPLWLPVLGAFAAEFLAVGVAGKMAQLTVSPPLFAGVLLRLIFPQAMTGWVQPFSYLPVWSVSVTVPGADVAQHPLTLLRAGNISSYSSGELLLGVRPGMIGELPALLLLAGGVYLILRGAISWRIPATYLVGSAVLFYLLPQSTVVLRYVLYATLSGGLLLCAFFPAADSRIAPVGDSARTAYALLCALFTVLLRNFAPLEEGALIAVLLAGLLSRSIDYLLIPKPFGCSYRE